LLIKEADRELVDLFKLLSEQKTQHKVRIIQLYSETDIEAKENKYRWMVKRLDDLKRGEGMDGMGNERGFEDMKHELMGEQQILVEDVKGREGDMMDFEKEAVGRWKEMDKKIDEFADRIGENVVELKNRALGINNALERQEEKLGKVEEVVDLANEEVETSTKRLKKLIVKVRAGDKFCCTLCLLILLIGLIVVAYNVIKI
jgi:rubrerythrin